MSRYEYPPEHWPDPMSFAIGWDPPVDTYFAQVWIAEPALQPPRLDDARSGIGKITR
jgi:hypothetical protein